jgi:hypothetical protein
MKTSSLLASVVGAVVVASLATSCGDNSAVCGDGTVEVDGVCVPEEEVVCGNGTTNVGGECVPDGTVICDQGTVFDEESGTCVVDPTACAEGTVLVDGVCVPEDETLTADHEEVAEPNDGILETDDIAGQFALDAVGGSTTIHGCINPYRDLDDNGNPDADLDLWIVTTTGPALVDITADGVGGLAAGYQVISATGDDLIDDNFVRFGINLTGDTSSRQMYLPGAGVYGIFMADSRSLFLQDGAAGSPEACYYTTITNVAVPSPTAATLNTEIAGTHDGDVDFYSADAADCSFFIGVHDMQAAAAFSSIWAIRNTTVFEYAEPDGAGTPGVVRTGGLTNADTVLYVIDPIYNYALDPVGYTLEVIAPPAGPMPLGGGDIAVTNVDTGEDFVGCFDTMADTMYHFDLTFTDDMRLVFIDEHGFLVTDRGTVTSFFNWIKFPAPARYHGIMIETELAADVPSITATSEIVTETITPIVPGTLIDDHAFNDFSATWHSFDPGTSVWLSFNATATDWGSDVTLDFLPLAGIGVPYINFPFLSFMDIPADGLSPGGRIVYGDGNDYLVRVDDFNDGVADATSTYDLDVDVREFTDLGTVTVAAPVAQTGFDLAEATDRLFFVRASRGGVHTVTVTPTGFDAVVEFLNVTESVAATVDSAGDGGAESSARTLTTNGWIAFRVSNFDGTDTGVFDVGITSVTEYEVAPGNLIFADICSMPGAQVVATGDEAISAALAPPAGFTLFGEAITTFWASTNGFISFAAPTGSAFYPNGTIPSATDPDGLVAPFWDDLDLTQVCYLATATLVTVQWTGEKYDSPYTPVQFQARIRNTGVIEFIYGTGHTSTGASATVGLENLDGTLAQNLGTNTAASVAPGMSVVLTPNP